jgi:lipopolysaccharide/colanic/teichoic acid biosynthesis glycosyltransferase/glycosyltransferase involved in cell wall biosynthesis
MKPPLRLLFVDNSLDTFYSYRLPLAKAACRAGFDVHVAAPPGKCGDILREHGIKVHSVFMTRSGMKLHEEVRCVHSLYRLYKQVRPDLIHHLRLKPVLYGGLAAYAAHVPAEVSMPTGLGHVFTADTKKARFMRAITLLGCRVAFRHNNLRVIFQNPDDRKVFVDSGTLSRKSCSLIRGSGVDISEFSVTPEPQGIPVVLLAARMLLDKGICEFVEAARIVRAAGLKARFVMVGGTDPGNPTAVSTEQLQEWEKEGVVEWWGHRSDMHQVLTQANVVCLPSYREGVPKVLIEAAAAARVIVTTDVPGCREIVQHGKNGLLVPPQNAQKIAEAVTFLLENPAVRARMARRGRHFAVANFSVDRVITETISIYNDVLSRRRGQDRLIARGSAGTEWRSKIDGLSSAEGNETEALSLKRALDFALAVCGMLVLWPLYLLVALAVRASSPGPILYGGVRIGQYGVPFRMWKFRTMVVNADRLGGSATAGDDVRITPIGRWLRRYKLDELPQLFNVFIGQMSFVGPRPEVAKYINMLKGEERRILDVKPGITDWASIWNSNEAEALKGSPDPESTYEQLIRPTKIQLQLRYADEHSFTADVKILFHTFLKLLNPGWVPKELASVKPVGAYKDLVKI